MKEWTPSEANCGRTSPGDENFTNKIFKIYLFICFGMFCCLCEVTLSVVVVVVLVAVVLGAVVLVIVAVVAAVEVVVLTCQGTELYKTGP